ncbi:MAG: hypothetical protein JNL58_19670 [Planctomyces sp.]|nr:hypothetical protein [Planctomyces sp.]
MFQMIRSMTITSRLFLLVGIAVTSLLLNSVSGWWTLSTAKVNGPYYKEIIVGKDVLADILPPPEYIVESYLTAMQLVDASETMNTTELTTVRRKLEQLKSDYVTRHRYWEKELRNEQMRTLLLEKSYEPAQSFFKVVDQELIPACESGNVEHAKKVLRDTAKKYYEEHRKAVDELVEVATQFASDTEATAIKDVDQRNYWTQFLAGFLVVTAVVLGWTMARGICRRLTESANAVRDVVRLDLCAVSEQMQHNAEETTHQATLASGAAEEVSTNAQALSTAVQEFNASIREISGNTSHAAAVASAAVEAANRTNSTVMKLGESSEEIGNVIKVINSIAEQTNLLALNATIEAARAGEAGKGFAVVANEVKELAKQTSHATEDIIRKIAMIQEDTHQAVDAIGQVSGIIRQISESQNAIASAVEEQSAMTGEISRNISEVAAGSSEIAKNITRVAEAAKNTSEGTHNTMRAAGDIEAMADDLLSLVGEVRQALPGRITATPAESNSRPIRSTRG